MRSLSVLSKILGLTASSNPHEAKAAEEKLEKQLQEKGITREQLEQQLDMATVEEDIEAIAFRFGKPYKRIDPATSIILNAVAEFYNGRIIYCVRDEDGNRFYGGTRQMEVLASKARQLEIEIYTEYLLQALQDDWAKHCKEDPFQVAMQGSSHRNSFRKAWAYKVAQRFQQMRKEEETDGRQIQTESKTINQSALAVTKSNNLELAAVKDFMNQRYPRLGTRSGFTHGGSGSGAGSAAGGRVGLNRQVAGGGQRRLAGS